MFKKILIANRGEIACRVIRTAKRLGIHTTAVYSEVDQYSQHVLQADDAFLLGPEPVSESYLNVTKIIEIAVSQNIDAIHPGYGFLSENTAFAKACADNNIVFIGPSADSITLMGNKAGAKQLLAQHQVPLIPGYNGDDQSNENLLQQAKSMGFPVLIKAAQGGGGKGMRLVETETEFASALDAAKREAKSSFGDDFIIIEKYLKEAKHIEVQVFGDSHGNAVHLFERDCSSQRRHQKVIEEAPSDCGQALQQKLYDAALNVVKAIDYLGAGTIEFLVAGDECYFMEMNTRLQVEHPVTEMITGFDLVEWQLLIAAGEPLPLKQQEITCSGHAIELRIYAEDPDNHFMPSTGKISYFHAPAENSSIRFDCGLITGDSVTQYYDPMIGKLIVHADNREHCLQNLRGALSQLHIVGIKTNCDFLMKLIQHDLFVGNAISTQSLETIENELQNQQSQLTTALELVSLFQLLQMRQQACSDPFSKTTAWQANLNHLTQFNYSVNNAHHQVKAELGKELLLNDHAATGELHGNQLQATLGNEHFQVSIVELDDDYSVFGLAESYQVSTPKLTDNAQLSNDSQLSSPMPATVVAIFVDKGTVVAEGDKLIVVEAMKMEHTIRAPYAGEVIDLPFNVGDKVAEGLPLVNLAETGA